MQVPWGRKELAIGLFSWAVSFVAVGIVLVPIIGFAAGVKVRMMPQMHHDRTCIDMTGSVDLMNPFHAGLQVFDVVRQIFLCLTQSGTVQRHGALPWHSPSHRLVAAVLAVLTFLCR